MKIRVQSVQPPRQPTFTKQEMCYKRGWWQWNGGLFRFYSFGDGNFLTFYVGCSDGIILNDPSIGEHGFTPIFNEEITLSY
jgi:hypothetical protein